MPFLQMSSGHHQVANGLIDSLHEINDVFECEKIDILSYSYGEIEGFISKFYIKWIQLLPELYSWVYMKSAYKNEIEEKRFYLYEWLFLYWIEKLIKEKNPELIICTHALPSYLLSQLKQKGKLSIPVINVYTDYFINQLWGIDSIDYHFVPNKEIKEVLVKRGVKSSQVLLTGIPIHPEFKKQVKVLKSKEVSNVLISGGNMGTGQIKSLVETLKPTGKILYVVLCGKNMKLYNWITNMNDPFILPVPFISSKEVMNELYDKVDAIITKPGGVTISECLYKKIPIFIYHELPGQEQINFQNLIKWGLVFQLDNWRETIDFEKKILTILHCDEKQKDLSNQLDIYHQHLSKEQIPFFIEQLLNESPQKLG